MAVIKCKMCGGDLSIIEGATVAECEYCGSKQTLPKLDDQQRAVAFDRGNHFRRLGEFDKALTVYERIVQEDENDAEAHWCCALCRFGIEYVQDPASGEYLPTCHRASFDSFLEDVDYKAALARADVVARRQYERDGRQIAAVQRGILATVQKEEPFDVFLCYKETDENGSRTVDSTLAQDIYYQLTEQGRRVFFARITLENKAGQEYESYIFAALHSAKVMVVVGTKPEHLNAVWVKNEWNRYLALMRQDRKRLLIPCYRDMDPYDLPEQLSVLQSYDMSKIGFIQDLIRGVAKVLDADKPKAATMVKESVVVQGKGGSSLTALLKRGNMSLEDSDWTRADSFFEQALNMDAECAQAYLGKALAAEQCRSLQALAAKWKYAEPKRKALTACSEDTARIDTIIKKYVVPSYLEEDTIRQTFQQNKFDFTYQSEADSWRTLLDEAEAYFTRDKLMGRAVRYATGDLAGQIETVRKELQAALSNSLGKAKQEDKESVRQVKKKYAAYLDWAEATAAELSKEAQERRESAYSATCYAQEKADTEKQYINAAEKFDMLGDYRDSVTRAKACRAVAERQRVIEIKQKKTQATRNKRIGIIAASVTVVAVLIGIVVTQIIIPSGKYRNAEALLAAGDYDGAVAILSELGNYKDAENRINQVHYAKAEALLAARDYNGAAAVFGELGNYKDAEGRVLEANYAEGEKLLAEGDIAGAVELFQQCGNYNDASARIPGIYYTAAENFLNNRNVINAAIYFGKAGSYMDATDRSYALWNQIAHRETLVAAMLCTWGVKQDGTVIRTNPIISPYHWQSDTIQRLSSISDWKDIVAISCKTEDLVVGLKRDGSVVAVGENSSGQCDVGNWSDIVAISAGSSHAVGLKCDGTVLTTGDNSYGQCDVDDWTDIVAIGAGPGFTVGLKSDGTVVATGYNSYGMCNVDDWSDIVAISVNDYRTIGLKADGSVLAVGINDERTNISGWSDIVVISAGTLHTAGLKRDGTVVATGVRDGEYGWSDVSGWTDIIAISAGDSHTAGLKTDGTVVAVGDNEYGQCDVSGWSGIKVLK